jgi:hypothetical protein
MFAPQQNGEAMTGSVARRVVDLKYRLALAAMPAGYGGYDHHLQNCAKTLDFRARRGYATHCASFSASPVKR